MLKRIHSNKISSFHLFYLRSNSKVNPCRNNHIQYQYRYYSITKSAASVDDKKVATSSWDQFKSYLNISSESQPTSTRETDVKPLKAMLFIDGTYLYYSVNTREEGLCPIIKQFGMGWQEDYKFDWSKLPNLICEKLQEQQIAQERSWSSLTNQKQTDSQFNRPIEISRASVYASYRQNTRKNSLRVRMFQEMEETNYIVHHHEALGSGGNKGAAVQLAVDMFHYATVPDSYDIAIMLTGDKEFIPAMMCVRQRGKQIAMVAMRNACNTHLFESSDVKDYDIIWLEDLFNELIVPIDEDSTRGRVVSSSNTHGDENVVSVFVFIKLIHDFISKVDVGVSSRDIGRFLKSLNFGDCTMLERMKENHNGLRNFLMQYGRKYFIMYHMPDADRGTSFLVKAIGGSENRLLDEACRTTLSSKEEKFLKNYYAQEEQRRRSDGEDNKDAYYHTFEDTKVSGFFDSPGDVDYAKVNGQIDQDSDDAADVNIDYSKQSEDTLKLTCIERGLSFTGSKSDLIQRIVEDDHVCLVKYLDNLVKELVKRRGGRVNSGDVGRYLKERPGVINKRRSALNELKRIFTSLRGFIDQRKEVFVKFDDNKKGDFYIKLR